MKVYWRDPQDISGDHRDISAASRQLELFLFLGTPFPVSIKPFENNSRDDDAPWRHLKIVAADVTERTPGRMMAPPSSSSPRRLRVRGNDAFLLWTFDPIFGAACERRFPGGSWVENTDALSDLTTINYPVSPDITLGYDSLNRLTNMVDAVGATGYSYTAFGALQSEDGPWADDAVTYSYPANRLRGGLSLAQASGPAWSQSYADDTVDRLSTLTSPAGAFGYTYGSVGTDVTPAQLIRKLTLPGGSTITNQFDEQARQLGTTLRTSGGDAAGANLRSASYTNNTLNQITGRDVPAYLNVIGAATATAPSGSRKSLSFGYDPQGRRISKIARDWTGSTWIKVIDEKYLYDGWNQLTSLNANNTTVVRAFLWGSDLSGSMQGAGGVGGLLAVNARGSGVGFVAYDGNGNVTALVDAAIGNTVANYEYGPFGEVIRASGTLAKLNPFRFSTKFQDDETDQLYYGYRNLNPSIGRWLNRDPIHELGHQTLRAKRTYRVRPDDANLFGFVHNNPLSKIDPDGRHPVVGGAIVVGVGVGLGYCLDRLGCWARVSAALSNGEGEANRVAPDGSTHRGATAVEGGDADALTHCIAACNLGNRPYPCFGADGALNSLQGRETGNDLGTQIDRLNNEVGIGVGVGLLPGENCTTECLGALRRGLLNEITNGQIVPSSVQ